MCLTLLPIVVFLNLGLGKTSLIPGPRVRSARRFRPRDLAQVLAASAVDTLIASPFFVRGLAGLGPHAAPGLKRIFSGGAPVFPSDAQAVAQALPRAEFTVVYGSTEAEPISHLDARSLLGADDPWDAGLLVGTPDPGVEVRILALTEGPVDGGDLDRLTLPRGEVGEICVAGPHVLDAYFENPEALTLNKIRGDKTFHRTGDAGFLDPAGRLFLVGRARQIVRDSRGAHYPFLLEARLREVPNVALGTCVALDGRAVLVVEPAPGTSADTLRAALASGPLRDYPVRFVRRIPRDPRHHSKIDFDALTALL